MDFHKPDSELSIGDTLSLTFDVYTSHLLIFLIPFLIVSIITGGFALVVNHYGSNIPSPDPTQSLDVYFAELGPFLANLIVLLLVFLLVSWVCTTIATGISTKCASDIIRTGKTNLEEAFRFTSGKLISLLAATLIVATVVFLGTVALVIPGLIFAVMFAVVLPIIMNENSGAINSLSRSRKLADDRWLKTFTLLLVVGLILVIVYFIASLIAAPFGQFSELVSSILASAVAPIPSIAITIHYYSMLAKNERKALLLPPPPF